MSENLQQLQALAQKPAVVTWFTQHFLQMRLQFTEPNERFTLFNRNAHIEIVPGFPPAAPPPKDLFGWLGFHPSAWYAEEFVVPLQTDNLRRLKEALSDGDLDPCEAFRIATYLTQPLLRAALSLRILRNPVMLWLLRIPPFWQQALLDPTGHETQPLTVIFIGGQWLLIPGYYGRPPQRYLLTAEQILAMQRRMLRAEQEATVMGWLQAVRWFWDWRATLMVNR